MKSLDSKERFSNRVDNYVLFRPSYPPEAIDNIVKCCTLTANSRIADIGSGTGKLTRPLLERGFTVYALEPNENMRRAAEKELLKIPGFKSISASAEETKLPDSSIDAITAAQSFHWFDKTACKQEWRRILKPDGKVALIWNSRDKTSDFMSAYENAIQHHSDEKPNLARDKITSHVFDDFFDGGYNIIHYTWKQSFGFEGLWGRAQSSSYSPAKGHPKHEPLKKELHRLFEQYQKGGTVLFDYKTEVVIGKI